MRKSDVLPAGWDRPLTRRELLRRAGRGTLGLAAVSFLAACGVEGQRREQQTLEPLPPKAGELEIANWPLYIDKAQGEPVTPQTFEERFDVETTYKEVISDNEEFFGTIRDPLANGQPTGWDIIVVTDWLVAKMIELGYVEPLHKDQLPNVEQNLSERFRDPWYDPGNAHSVPWAAGITGIAYDVSLTGRDLTSFDELFDPALEGRVGLFSEMRDTMGLALLSLGIEPATATVDDARAAQQKLLDNRANVRGFYGNEYADQLATKTLAASMAWSGDVFAIAFDNPDLRFVIPDEGAMRWVDNMVVPAGAEHPTDAHLFMNFVYSPRIATNITEWVWYESPVDPVRDLIAQDAEGGPGYLKRLAESDLVWPGPEIADQLHAYPRLEGEEETAWNELFQEVVTG